MASLSGKRVAIIATDGFEYSELNDPLQALRESGAQCDVIAPKGTVIRGWRRGNWAENVPVNYTLGDISAEDYDALFIPGGTINCDKLRMNSEAVDLVSDFFNAGKPVGAICHGPQLLIEADVLDGRKITSYSAIRKDLENAGAEWSDEEVVVDQGLVTSRSPEDLPAFIPKLIEEIQEGIHAARA